MFQRERPAAKTEHKHVAFHTDLLMLEWLFYTCITLVTCQNIPEPTRPIDLWNPFGVPSTPRPDNQALKNDEVIVRLPIGDMIGKSKILYDLPWSISQDPSERIPLDRSHFDANYRTTLLNNITVYSFLGVPYAEPPVSQRRLQPPQRLTSLPGNGPYLAFNYGSSCAQDVEKRPQPSVNDPYPFTVSEDCLYLNVFTPDVSKSSGNVYPVIVFFHGGNFQTGSASEWPAHGLASRGLVVVTVNYRLGALGFMSLGDRVTGNYGLQDQKLSLEWVRDFISSFGGDPQAVTIAGQDAGGVSVGLHMLSPLSKNLFRSAASMSGAEVSYHSSIGKPALAFNNTIKLGRYLGCTQAVAQHVWDCILTRSTDDIVRATTDIPIEFNRYLFLPTVDGKYVPANPFWALRSALSGNFPVPSPVPYLIGMNAQDGSEVILEDRLLGEFNDFNNVDQEYMKSFALEYSFRHNYSMNREAITEAMIDRYTYWPDVSDVWSIRQGFIAMATDAYYTAPIIQSADLHSSVGSRTFMYVNNYNFSRGNEALRFIPDWMDFVSTACWYFGMSSTGIHLSPGSIMQHPLTVSRDSELFLMFAYAFMPPELRPYHLKNVTFTQHDKNASQLFSNIIRRFTTHQNPNFLFDGSWSAYQPRRHWYLNFNYSDASEMSVPGKLERDYRYQHVAFWNEYLPALVNYMTTTFPPSEVSVRRQLVVFQWLVAVAVLIIMLLLVVGCTFGYLLFEDRNIEKQKRETHQLIEVVDSFDSSTSIIKNDFRGNSSRISVL